MDLVEFLFQSGEKIVEFREFMRGSLNCGKIVEKTSDGFGDESGC